MPKKMTHSKKTLLVLGGVFVAFGLVWRLFIAPYFERLPSDFSYRADVYSVDNFYNPDEDSFRGAEPSKTKFYYETQGKHGDVLEIKNFFSVSTFDNKPIIALERTYGIDRKSLAHVSGFGDKDRNGYLFAPRNLKPNQNFRYWHINYDTPADMKYVSSEAINGLKVFRYRADIFADQTKNLGDLPGVPEKYGINLDAVLDIWVEPQTGRLIKYEDSATAYYYDLQTGKRAYPWNKFSNRFTESSIATQISIARQQIFRERLRRLAVPLACIIISLILLVFGLGIPLLGKSITFILPAVSLVITVVLSIGSMQNARQIAGLSYNARAQELVGAVRQRLLDYSATLRGSKGLFAASDEVTRKEWHDYVATVDVRSNLPGVQGVGYSEKIGDAGALGPFVNRIRQTGLPGFDIKPAGSRDEYHSIIYLEPMNERNARALGFDMFQEPVRREGMLLARDSGEMTLSRKVTLVQENGVDIQNGFLMYLPIYKMGMATTTPEERQAALKGFVYSPFRAGDFFQGIISQTGEDITFAVYDHQVTPDTLLYRNSKEGSSDDTSSLSLEIGGTTWTFQIAKDPGASQLGGVGGGAWTTLAVGLAMTGLLTIVLLSYRRTNQRAQILANRITEDLRKSNTAAQKSATESQEAQAQLNKSSLELQNQNKLLENTKKAMLNILEDLNQEKTVSETKRVRDEAMLESIAEGLIVITKDGAVERINKSAQDIFGYSEKEMMGRKLYSILKVLDEKGKAIPIGQRPAQKVLGGSGPIAAIFQYVKKNNERIPVYVSVAPIIAKDKIIGAIEVFRDVTKEKEVDQAKTEFVSLASHQLRTPLSTINWYSEMLLEGDAGKLTDEQVKYVDEIYRGNQRMVALVGDLLNVSRIDLGTFMVDPEPTNIIEMAQKIVQDMEPRIFKQKIDFREEYGKNMPLIQVDHKLMRMVIDNLASNAVKYTPEKGKVTLSIKREKDQIHIRVQDSGYGIPEKQQNRIFSKLFRADNVKSKDTEGTGLGLYITKSIVDFAGGKIWFESAENRGTTFHVMLPLAGMKQKWGDKPLE